MVPGPYGAGLGRELRRCGFFQSGFHASLVAQLPAPPVAAGQYHVEPVTSATMMEDYLEANVAGWGIAAK
jgi:hypothetical protein